VPRGRLQTVDDGDRDAEQRANAFGDALGHVVWVERLRDLAPHVGQMLGGLPPVGHLAEQLGVADGDRRVLGQPHEHRLVRVAEGPG